MEGKKNDSGKAALDLVPWDVIAPLARDWVDSGAASFINEPHLYGERLAFWWRVGDRVELRNLFMSICRLHSDRSEIEVAIAETVVPVLEFGARKYAAWNWAKGMKWSRLYAAALRHWLADLKGEQCDSETGLSHLQHMACCLMFLLVYEADGIGEDDRPDYAPRKAA